MRLRSFISGNQKIGFSVQCGFETLVLKVMKVHAGPVWRIAPAAVQHSLLSPPPPHWTAPPSAL
jgi:hypothetical protein